MNSSIDIIDQMDKMGKVRMVSIGSFSLGSLL